MGSVFAKGRTHLLFWHISAVYRWEQILWQLGNVGMAAQK